MKKSANRNTRKDTRKNISKNKWEEEKLLQEKYNGEKGDAFFADCARLARGEPLAYLIGHVPFLETTIRLDSHPLIPRVETEYWVEQTIQLLRARHTQHAQELVILDLCAGSGCIGVAVLHALPGTSVDFVEIGERHHPTIEKNLVENGIDRKRARIFGGDLFEHVTARYDAVLTNPPYIDPQEDRTEESVRRFEPQEALYGGTGGTEYIRRIIVGASEHLRENGVLCIEHEPEHVACITTLAEENGLVSAPYEDQYGAMRYTQLTKENKKDVQQ